jgi:hypothetical protein
LDLKLENILMLDCWINAGFLSEERIEVWFEAAGRYVGIVRLIFVQSYIIFISVFKGPQNLKTNVLDLNKKQKFLSNSNILQYSKLPI